MFAYVTRPKSKTALGFSLWKDSGCSCPGVFSPLLFHHLPVRSLSSTFRSGPFALVIRGLKSHQKPQDRKLNLEQQLGPLAAHMEVSWPRVVARGRRGQKGQRLLSTGVRDWRLPSKEGDDGGRGAKG